MSLVRPRGWLRKYPTLWPSSTASAVQCAAPSRDGPESPTRFSQDFQQTFRGALKGLVAEVRCLGDARIGVAPKLNHLVWLWEFSKLLVRPQIVGSEIAPRHFP